MVLISSGPNFAGNLCDAYRQVLKSLMAINACKRAYRCGVQWVCDQAQVLQVWRAGRLLPVQVTIRDLGVDTLWTWFAWGNPVQQKRISSFHVSMTRMRALGISAHVKTRTVKFLLSVGLYGAEVGGMSDQHMTDLKASACGALGKGAALRRSAALELMAHGGPSANRGSACGG
eukprot:3937000-Amphidinium_carterae.2